MAQFTAFVNSQKIVKTTQSQLFFGGFSVIMEWLWESALVCRLWAAGRPFGIIRTMEGMYNEKSAPEPREPTGQARPKAPG